MITSRQYTEIAALIADIADTEALTRHRALTDTDIDEKQPGDLVTTADRATEEHLTRALENYLPGSTTVGEETTHTHPAHLDRIHTDTPVWIIDPIDGTAEYVNGGDHFSTLVALTTNGTVHASWIYGPALALTAGALTGCDPDDRGAWINGEPAHLAAPPPSDTLTVVTSNPAFADARPVLDRLDRPGITRVGCRSAGLSYVDLVQGHQDAAVFTWEYPWDHAAGLHLLTTAGGHQTTMDGTPFSLSGGNRLPLVAGHHNAVDRLTALLTP